MRTQKSHTKDIELGCLTHRDSMQLVEPFCPGGSRELYSNPACGSKGTRLGRSEQTEDGEEIPLRPSRSKVVGLPQTILGSLGLELRQGVLPAGNTKQCC